MKSRPAAELFGLDDWPPLLDLGPLKGAERLRRLLVAGVNLLPEIGQSLTHRRIGQRGHDRTIELSDDVLRRSLGRPNALPCRNVKSRQSGFVLRGNIWRRRRTARRCNRIGFDGPGA